MPVKYDASSLKIHDDPVAFVRRRRDMFVGSNEVQPSLLATYLAHSVLNLGCKQVEIHHVGEWWAVASEEDWLTYHNKLDVRQTFNRMLPIPGWVNACRYEVVVRALADSVFTSKAGEVVIISGDEGASRRLLAQAPLERLEGKRVVAFAMASNNAPIGQPNG